MLKDIQKSRIKQRFELFEEHMDKGGKDTELIESVKIITAQMDDDEQWIASFAEAAYITGSVNALMQLLIDPE